MNAKNEEVTLKDAAIIAVGAGCGVLVGHAILAAGKKAMNKVKSLWVSHKERKKQPVVANNTPAPVPAEG